MATPSTQQMPSAFLRKIGYGNTDETMDTPAEAKPSTGPAVKAE